jgi:hypothetical protein
MLDLPGSPLPKPTIVLKAQFLTAKMAIATSAMINSPERFTGWVHLSFTSKIGLEFRLDAFRKQLNDTA